MTRSRLPQMPRVRERTARAGLARRKANRRHQPAIEVLEQRLEMAQVSWTGLGDGTTWQAAKNWSSNAVPGASDDVSINVANNPTIIYNGTSTIHSLVDNDSLNIAGGSLTVTSGASQVVGSLNVASGDTFGLRRRGVIHRQRCHDYRRREPLRQRRCDPGPAPGRPAMRPSPSTCRRSRPTVRGASSTSRT